MKTALDLDYLIPSRCAPGYSESCHGGLGAGGNEPEHLHARIQTAYPSCQADLQLAWCAVKPAFLKLIHNSLHDLGIPVAKDHGTVGQTVIDQPVSVQVPEVGPLCP